MSPNLITKLTEILYQKLSNYNSTKINNFLNKPTKKNAINIAKKLCEHNEKEGIINGLLNNLLNFENGINKGRDHVIHTVHTYLLGMIIIDALKDESINKFTWKIASLFHDIGYEHADRFSIIQSNNILSDHGLVGAIITWDLIHSQYLKENPKKEEYCIKDNPEGYTINYSWNNLNNYILPACEAILLHNEPKYYRKTKLAFSDNKYAYLLIICDTLQEWSRPQNRAITSISGSSPNLYSINCSCNNGYCELSMDFPTVNRIKAVGDELRKKCSCSVRTNSNKLTVKWEY